MFVVVTQDNQGGNQFINGPFETRTKPVDAQKHAGILAAEDESEASGEDGEFWFISRATKTKSSTRSTSGPSSRLPTTEHTGVPWPPWGLGGVSVLGFPL